MRAFTIIYIYERAGTFLALGGCGVVVGNSSRDVIIEHSSFVEMGQSGVLFAGNDSTQAKRCAVTSTYTYPFWALGLLTAASDCWELGEKPGIRQALRRHLTVILRACARSYLNILSST